MIHMRDVFHFLSVRLPLSGLPVKIPTVYFIVTEYETIASVISKLICFIYRK
ncbi:hypothetical protein VR7878_03947 [Vibrio ruber DSM 16370]|uniref:Uncharacterized protein n=1 Tax=Vibrio ruber (strain DSM 16370 / JCM 11486 / BCRC 17186 / CECT 7878 / LMG 23124 / VR1) TaxID=1123498 RepID=A0A1R4LTY3_VIBR1|nr:hypothetical protein VR7878_03947 [Vibrio ruber DSM 16370]